MTAYTVERLHDLPIVLVSVFEDWESQRDGSAAMERVAEILDEASEPLYYISDLTQSPQWGIGDIVSVANLAARGRAIVKHPNLRGIIAITTFKLIDLAAKGMNSDAFGNVPVHVFPSLEEGLAFVRSQTGTG